MHEPKLALTGNHRTVLNIAFLVVALTLRFARTRGREMLAAMRG
jgi:hypothetical protein